VVNCGLGGDTVSAMNNKLPYFIKMCPNTEYVLMCVGANDRTATADQIIEGLETATSIVRNANKTPVLFTINPASAGYNNAAFPIVNSWIRQSGFHYVDMDKVFYNPDGTINQGLFLQDGIHPTVEGHLRIFRRIQTDCPFLF
jgi:lysophospholipase L1-like esterase